MQVLADTYGAVLVAGTRDCTLQRRYQKIVEEAPAPFLAADQRAALGHAAAAICREAGYINAGTVEFLLSPAGELSFLEVNTRLQVEHSATEETIDVDLVRAQLLIAAGRPLAEFDVAGVQTTLPFLRAVLAEPAFTGDSPDGFAVHTRWIEQEYLPAAAAGRPRAPARATGGCRSGSAAAG